MAGSEQKKSPIPGAGELYTFYGCHIELADPINGFYIQQPDLTNGKPYFMRQNISRDSDPMMIWFMPKMNLWMVNNRSQLGSENAKAVVKSSAYHPKDITEHWHVFFPGENNFEKTPNQTFRKANPAEESQTRQKKNKSLR